MACIKIWLPDTRLAFLLWMNFTVLISLARVGKSSCSTGSSSTDAKTSISFGVSPITVWFSCMSDKPLARKYGVDLRLLTQAGDAFVDGLVLLIVFLQWENFDNSRNDIINWDLVWVSHDHAAEASGGII